MTFSHPYGEYNVQASFNEYVRVNLTAQGIPAWMPSARLVYDYPETPLISGYSGHAFSITHLETEPIQEYQGRNVSPGAIGQTVQGMADISCWVSKAVASAAAEARLRQMADMVKYLFVSGRSTAISDWYGSLTQPTGIGAIVRFGEARSVGVSPDKNPDLMRRRFLVNYTWLERVTG